MGMAITVCASAAGETCPLWPGAPVRAHWGDDAPGAAAEPEWDTAFRTAFTTLAKRAAELLDLPFESMRPEELPQQLKRIGENA